MKAPSFLDEVKVTVPVGFEPATVAVQVVDAPYASLSATQVTAVVVGTCAIAIGAGTRRSKPAIDTKYAGVGQRLLSVFMSILL
jgi:hypothetical protein